MSDYGARVADKAIASVSKEIRQVYSQAAKELQGKLNTFLEAKAEKIAKKQKELSDGLITQQQYQSWLTGQLFMEKQWKDKLEQATKVMYNANKEAAQVVHEKKLDVFAENYNHSAYEIEKKAGVNVGFNLYDTKSAARLVSEDPDILPKWKINEKKDYKWNYSKAKNAVTQGIIQGESVDEITKRLVSSLSAQNENKMRTFARTAITGAQNAGRLESLHDAQEEGIKVKKKWLATLDNRTRDTHRDLDGQVQDVDDPFTSDLGDIMFPGDPNADPANTYNCRCTMIYVYEGIDRKSIRRDDEGQLVENMTYREWEAMKEGTKQGSTALETKIEEANKGTNIFGETISFSDKMDSPKWDAAKAVINDLSAEFETKLKEVKPGSQHSAGAVQISGTVMNLSSAKAETAIHEFAHTISVLDQTKFGLYDEADFWNEIRGVRTEYRKERKQNQMYSVSTYADSENKLDEFMAESFTMAYMIKNGFSLPDKYGNATKTANEVYDIVKKYFGKKR